MKVLILGNDKQVADIRDTISGIIRSYPLSVDYNSRTDIFISPTQIDDKKEIRVYLQPDWRNIEHMELLEQLRIAIISRVSLKPSQVMCTQFFP